MYKNLEDAAISLFHDIKICYRLMRTSFDKKIMNNRMITGKLGEVKVQKRKTEFSQKERWNSISVENS